MGVGSGITFDSDPAAEYAESLGKAAFLHGQVADFSLLETLRLENGNYIRLEQHLARLEGSACFFGFPFDRESVVRLLENIEPVGSGPLRVRLVLQPDGAVTVTTAEISPEKTPLVVGISPVRVDPSDRLLYHKTTERVLRDRERENRTDCDEVVFFNSRGELTEGSYNTIILRIGGRLLTPLLECGLLPGVLRGELLDSGEIEEKILYPEDLSVAEEIWLVNSLRGRRQAVIAEGEAF
jgi:para-aminobenzoate synthetase/4-amino-4-deoxychorismate lyase